MSGSYRLHWLVKVVRNETFSHIVSNKPCRRHSRHQRVSFGQPPVSTWWQSWHLGNFAVSLHFLMIQNIYNVLLKGYWKGRSFKLCNPCYGFTCLIFPSPFHLWTWMCVFWIKLWYISARVFPWYHFVLTITSKPYNAKKGTASAKQPGAPFINMDQFNTSMGKQSHPLLSDDALTFPFPNFNGATVEVWEWISNFIPHFPGQGMWLLIHAGIKVNPCW